MLVAVLTFALGLGGLALPAWADGTARLQLTATGMTPATGLTGSGQAFDLAPEQAGVAQEFVLGYTCPTDGAAGCVDAGFELALDDLVLEAWLAPHPTAPGSYTVRHLDEAGDLVDPATGALADVASIALVFTDDVLGQPGLVSGASGDLRLRARVLPPVGAGEQTGSLVVTPSDEEGSGPTTRVDLTTTFVPVLATETAKSWSEPSLLSGAGPATANTATIVATNTGEPARTFVVHEPADPTVVPSGTEAFNLLAVVGVELAAWPTGATSVVLTAWADGSVVETSPELTDLAGANTWLGNLDELRSVTGLRASFSAGSGHVATGATATLVVHTEQWGDEDGAVVARHGEVDFQRWGEVSDGFGSLVVENTAGAVASSGVEGEVPGTSEDSASTEILDPRPYAGSAKTYTAPGAAGEPVSEIPVGSYAVARIGASNWTRQAVEAMTLLERPTQEQVDANPSSLGLGDLDPDMFADSGLLFAGFGDGFVDDDPAQGPHGAGLVWPAGATALELSVTHTGGTATVVLSPGETLPSLGDLTAPDALASWSAVTGFTATFSGPGTTIGTGATASLPYLVTPGPAAQPGAVQNHVLATTSVGGQVSGVSPRTPDSGNRPVARAPLGVEAPSVGVELTKRIPQSHVSTAPGSRVLSVLQATSVPGNTEPTTLRIEELSDLAPRWWAVLAPVEIDLQVAVGDSATVSYRDGAGTWHEVDTYTTSQVVALGDTASWTGVRVDHTRPTGFSAGSRVQALVTFAVRDEPTTGSAPTAGEALENCAAARAAVEYGGTVYTAGDGPACDDLEVYDAQGGGPAALVKRMTGAVTEGSRGVLTARLSWGTRGQDLAQVTVTDGNAIVAGDPGQGAETSLWDTVDLRTVGRITSGPTSGPTADDPYLVFDQVAAVEYFDTTTGEWEPVAAAQTPYRGSDAGPGNDWVVMPTVELSDAERAVAGGVRLVYEPLTDDLRAQVAAALEAAGDWRAPLAAALTSGRVAVSEHPSREVVLGVSLRDHSRSTGEVINDAFVYNVPGEPGRVRNDAQVTGDGVVLGGPVGHVGERTVTVTPAVLAAAATKDWRRALDNGSTGADNSEVRVLALPTQASPEWPSAVLTVTGRNASPVRVDGLTLHEPAWTAPEDLVADDATFGWFDVTAVTSLTPFAEVPGATGMSVTVHRYDDATGTVVSAPVSRDDLLAMSAEELDDVVGVTVDYEGRIAPSSGPQARLEVATRLRDAHRVTGAEPVAGLAVDNTVRVEVGDERVCVGEPGGAAPGCERDLATAGATDTLRIADAEVKAFVTKSIDRASVHRDADHALEVRLDVQSFGNSGAERLELVDADPRFANAVGLSGARLVALADGADEARLEVVLARDGLTVTEDGEFSGPLTWLDAGTLTGPGAFALAGDAAGAQWSQVLGVRVTMADTDGSLIPSPGTNLGVVVLEGALRAELLSGGLPSALGAPASWAGESGANPGEADLGRVTNVATAQAYRTGVTSGDRTEHGDTLDVHAGRARLAIAKGSAPGTYQPGEEVPYRITVSNDAPAATGADVLGLTVVDHLPEDESLVVPEGFVVATSVAPGTDQLGEPDVVHDAAARTISVVWPDDARLAPGQVVTLDLTLRLSEQLSTIHVVNRASVTSSGRPVTGPGTDPDAVTSCAASAAVDPATGECSTSSSALALGGSNTFVSQKWVRTGLDAVHTVEPAGTCSPRGAGADSDWYRFPCSAQVEAGGVADWEVQVTSLAGAPTPSLEIIDMLRGPR